jgi:hypothetical protein
MAYLNLTYRRKADVDCGNEAAVKEDVATGDDWSHKAMGTRKENEAKKKGTWRHHAGLQRQHEVIELHLDATSRKASLMEAFCLNSSKAWISSPQSGGFIVGYASMRSEVSLLSWC